jgi:hypothetical protein
MIFCQEKENGSVAEGKPCFARGKVVWIDADVAKSELPELSHHFKEKPTPDSLEDMKFYLIEYFKKQSFVFFPEVLYRYKLNKNKTLCCFGINYFKID